jgi:putative PEP-CTERM system histidine kinase
VNGVIAFWSYALAACLFASILLWRLRDRGESRTTILLGAYFATAVWASVSAMRGPTDMVTIPIETLRNLAWVMLLHAMTGDLKDGAPRGIRLVFGAVALVIGIQLTLNLLRLAMPLPDALSGDVLATEKLLRITTATGAMVLVHNVYGLAAPQSRIAIRSAMLGLALTWGYDLNLYTLAYLQPQGAAGLFEYRGLFMALIAPLFILRSSGSKALRIRLSRAATFQSLSLLAICAYFAVMAVLATALRRSTWDWASAVTAALLATMLITTAVLVLSHWARGWVKVKLAKHLFEHRYDYRTEWLRFTDTLGRVAPDAAPLGERIIKAFADIVDAPRALLLTSDGGTPLVAAAWNWPAPHPRADQLEQAGEFWNDVENCQRVLELEALRRGWASPKDRELAVPDWMLADESVWAGIPLIHHERLIGIVLLGAPEYRRPLDWEDFDLLRTGGRQAASSLAEAQVQEALAKAQRFEEFNRRFAFILHDVKNLVSQLSLLSRNAERHADNPDFRADMVATLKSSVGKMNELLARLSPHASARVQRLEAQPLRPLLSSAIAAKRRDHDVRLLGDAGLCALVDASALEQAVGHLLQNAVDASPDGEPVTVRVSEEQGMLCVAIADRGCGMDSDFLRNGLFQPFVSTKPAGFGIGSFEARSLIKAMGGRVTVDSHPGRGTTFTILLPAAEPARERAQSTRKRA